MRVHVFPQKPESTFSSPLGQSLMASSVQDALLDQFAEQDRFRDILRHFAHNSIPILHAGPRVQSAWRESLPALASSHKFVLNGMIAIGSLHLAQLAIPEPDRAFYQDTAAAQMNAGMIQYRLEVQHVTTKNAEALLAFSTMVTVYALSTAGAESEVTLTRMKTNQIPDQTQTIMIQALSNSVSRIFRSIRGVLVIIVPCWAHIQRGHLVLLSNVSGGPRQFQ